MKLLWPRKETCKLKKAAEPPAGATPHTDFFSDSILAYEQEMFKNIPGTPVHNQGIAFDADLFGKQTPLKKNTSDILTRPRKKRKYKSKHVLESVPESSIIEVFQPSEISSPSTNKDISSVTVPLELVEHQPDKTQDKWGWVGWTVVGVVVMAGISCAGYFLAKLYQNGATENDVNSIHILASTLDGSSTLDISST